jgi:hypothetical protein
MSYPWETPSATWSEKLYLSRTANATSLKQQDFDNSIPSFPEPTAQRYSSNIKPTQSGSMELAAGLASAGAGVESSIITGAFNLGGSLVNANTSRENTKLITKTSYDIAQLQNEVAQGQLVNQRRQIDIQQQDIGIKKGQLEFQNSQLGLNREMWQKEWDSAVRAGLSNPQQFGQLATSNFAFSRGTGSALNLALRTGSRSVYGLNY